MSSGTASLVGVGGVALVAANFWTSPARATVHSGILDKNATADATTDAHKTLKGLLVQLLFVGAMVLIAGVSDSAATAMLAILAALGVLWAINHYSSS